MRGRGEYRIQFVAEQLLDVGLRVQLAGSRSCPSMNLGSGAWLSAKPQPAKAAAAPANTATENTTRRILPF